MNCSNGSMVARVWRCGGACRALAGASEKGSVDPGIVLKAGTTLVRQWRGHTHTVIVHKDGFEHEGQRYRSLTAIAERITAVSYTHLTLPTKRIV